jgi:ubiquitin conjugation factor E4 B
LEAFKALPNLVLAIKQTVAEEESLIADAPDEFSCELLCTFMKDPVRLPSGHVVDRSNITQHLLNDATDPFSRAPLHVEQIVPDIELKNRMEAWLEQKRASRNES